MRNNQYMALLYGNHCGSSGDREMNVKDLCSQGAQNQMKALWVNLLNNNVCEDSDQTSSRQFYIN